MTAAEIAVGIGDTITILRARGRRLSKLICSDGAIEDYDSARHFDLLTVPIAGLNELACLLRKLTARYDCCVVRGAIADPCRTQSVRRLVHRDLRTGDAPTLSDAPRRWLALDIDRVARPDDIAAPDLAACAAVAIELLPAEFGAAGCIVQATASHAFKPGVRLRLWYWLTRPTSGAELRRWLHGAPVDPAVFSAAQPIYTAAPLFEAGAPNPLTDRTIVVRGMQSTVPVPPASALIPPPRTRTRHAAVTPDAHGAMRYGFTALTAATARVARAEAGVRHPTLLAEARGLAGLVARNIVAERTVATALARAAEMAGLPGAEAASTIAWALAHPRVVVS